MGRPPGFWGKKPRIQISSNLNLCFDFGGKKGRGPEEKTPQSMGKKGWLALGGRLGLADSGVAGGNAGGWAPQGPFEKRGGG